MWVLVTYDVATDTAAGRARLRRVAQVCKNFGQRVQKSVFECTVNDTQYERLKQQLLKRIKDDEDSLRLYRLPQSRERVVEEFGIGHVVDFEGTLVV